MTFVQPETDPFTKCARRIPMEAEIQHLESNDFTNWSDFERYESADPCDDYGWFHVTVGPLGMEGGNDFQVCVATPRAVGRVKQAGFAPGILVDHFDAESVHNAIHARVTSINGHTWNDIVDQLRRFMHWEYEGMAGG